MRIVVDEDIPKELVRSSVRLGSSSSTSKISG
jgi:hypothetical protein